MSRLVQRCKGRYQELPEGVALDNLISLEYMGAAEYEFGAVQDSLKKLVDEVDRVWSVPFIILRDASHFNLLYIPHLKPLNDILQQIDEMVENKFQTKMPHDLDRFWNSKTIWRLKKGCIKKMEEIPNPSACNTDVWWDIKDHWMLLRPDYSPEVFITALRILKAKGYGKPLKPANIFKRILGWK